MAKKSENFKIDNGFNPEKFRVIFRAVFALVAFLTGMIFISFAVFSSTAKESEFTGPVIGFICGTLITLITTYYYGSADGHEKKADQFIPPHLTPLMKIPEIKSVTDPMLDEPGELVPDGGDEPAKTWPKSPYNK